MDLTGKLVVFQLRNKKVLGLVAIHSLDTNSITMHNMVDLSNLQPVTGRLGGIQMNANNVKLANL